jgi:hypothetical protein
MKETRVTFPELALIAGTRAAAGAGLGLLLSNRLSDSQRRAAGWALLLVGAVSTIPLVLEVYGHRCTSTVNETDRLADAPRSESNVRFDQPSALART